MSKNEEKKLPKKSRFFLDNPALSVFLIYPPLTSDQKLAKSIDRKYDNFYRNGRTDGRTHFLGLGPQLKLRNCNVPEGTHPQLLNLFKLFNLFKLVKQQVKSTSLNKLEKFEQIKKFEPVKPYFLYYNANYA